MFVHLNAREFLGIDESNARYLAEAQLLDFGILILITCSRTTWLPSSLLRTILGRSYEPATLDLSTITPGAGNVNIE